MAYPTTSDYIFNEGLDPTGIFTAPQTTALLSMIRLAMPNAYRGNVINATTTPATSGQPTGYPAGWYEWQKRCLWYNPGTGHLYGYRTGLGWDTIKLTAGAITTDEIANKAVTVQKINPGSSLWILRTNTAATAAEWAPLSTVLGSQTVNISSLIASLSPNSYYLRCDGSTKTWATLAGTDVVNSLALKQIPVNRLAVGTDPRMVLRTNATLSSAEWIAPTDIFVDGELNINKLSHSIGKANTFIKVNAAGNAIEYGTLGDGLIYNGALRVTCPILKAVSGTVTSPGGLSIEESGELSLPSSSGNSVNFTFTGTPMRFEAYLKCTTSDASTSGYVVGDVVSFDSFTSQTDGSSAPIGAVYSTGSAVSFISSVASSSYCTTHKTSGARVAITHDHWRLILKAVVLS